MTKKYIHLLIATMGVLAVSLVAGTFYLLRISTNSSTKAGLSSQSQNEFENNQVNIESPGSHDYQVPANVTHISGPISLTVIPVTFNKYPKHSYYDSGSESVSSIKSDIMQLGNYISETSFNTASLTDSSVQVLNRVTLNHTITLSDPSNPYSCQLDGNTWNNPWAQLTSEAMTAAHIDPTNSQHILLVLPGLSCGPYSRSDAWDQVINGVHVAWVQGFTQDPEYYDGVNPTRFSITTRKYLRPKGIIQGMGFTFGLSWLANDDAYDPMGNTMLNKPLVLFTSAHAEILGWMTQSQLKTMQLGSQDVSFRLKRYGIHTPVNDEVTSVPLSSAVKISSNGYTYYVEYRAPNSTLSADNKKHYGYDDGGGFMADTNAKQGLVVSQFEGSGLRVLAHLTASGQSYSDTKGNIRITLSELVDEYENYWQNEDPQVRVDIVQLVKSPITSTPTAQNTMIRQSFLSQIGDTYFQRTCPFDTTTGSPSPTCSAAWTSIFLASPPSTQPNKAGYIAAPVAKAGGIVTFLFPQNGTIKLRQSFLTATGAQQFHRTCLFNPSQSDLESYSSYKANNCTAWNGPYTVISIKGQTSYGGYAAFTFKTSVGVWKVRQSYLSVSGDRYYQRTCPFDTSTGGPSASCNIPWSEIFLATGPANTPGYIGAPVAKAGAIVNFLYIQNGTQKIRQSFMTLSGSQQFHRTCTFDPAQTDMGSYSSQRATGCTAWNGPYSVVSINGQTSYNGYTAITFEK